MTTTGDRLTRWFVEDAPGDLPNHILDAVFERTRALPQERPSTSDRGARRGRPSLLLAAALAIVTSVVAIALAGGWLSRVTTPIHSPDGLERIRTAGVLRVAVRPDHPQDAASGTLQGFDVEIATELARRLGLGLVLVEQSPETMQTDRAAWELALPSTPSWSIDPDAFTVTQPYYFWPHLVLVRSESGATSVDDVRGQPICAVDGDAGQSWLFGRYGGPTASPSSGPPIPSTLVLRATDEQCLTALETGEVLGVVTARLSPMEVSARSTVRAVGGPDPEPRSALIAVDAPFAAALESAVDRALAEMRRDGTLAALSTASFGSDLSTPGS
jgi:ABC-type amino acid transport substrate-binding protein